MHRDFIDGGLESGRGLCSKRFVADLLDRGAGREEAVEAIAEAFGVPRAAAELFVASHPRWAASEATRSWPWWDAARG